jgi:hypothetical protein
MKMVGKTPKTDDKVKVQQQHLVEALACPCEHPCVIKFLAINLYNMDAYTSWWNWGIF